MKITPLANNETANGGFTHEITLDYTDFTGEAAATDTSELVEILDVTAGMIVQDCATAVTTPFVNSEASTSCGLIVGIGTATDMFLTTQVVGGASGASTGSYAKYASPANSVDTFRNVFTAADTIDATLTVTGGSNNYVDTCTAGQVVIRLRICDMANAG